MFLFVQNETTNILFTIVYRNAEYETFWMVQQIWYKHLNDIPILRCPSNTRCQCYYYSDHLQDRLRFLKRNQLNYVKKKDLAK